MLGFATFAALLPQLRDAWGLTNAQAGIVGGMFFAGYVAAVSLWTALTDRTDAVKIYAIASLVTAAGSAGFAWLARGFASACFFQALLGAGIAGTYMPGLRLLSDRDLLRVQLQAYAACGDEDIVFLETGQVVELG